MTKGDLNAIYRVVIPAMQACPTFTNVDLLGFAARIPEADRSDHIERLYARLSDAERDTIAFIANEKLKALFHAG
jgi:hypothetical protein